MGLISYTNLEDGTDADANKFNERFGAIVDEVNGNLDSQNLANAAVTSPKIADGAVTSSKIATNRYIDANGWTVNDLGTTKTYTYTQAVTNVYVLNGQRTLVANIQPPVGRTRENISLSVNWYGGYSGHAIPSMESVNTTEMSIWLGNQYYLGPLTFNGKIYINAVETL